MDNAIANKWCLLAILHPARALVLAVAEARFTRAHDNLRPISDLQFAEDARHVQFGYNYQAHLFNGTYDSVDRKLDGTYWGATGDYIDDKLMMKWGDAWLANVDCDSDHKLDRGLVDGSVGEISLGWETNDFSQKKGRGIAAPARPMLSA